VVTCADGTTAAGECNPDKLRLTALPQRWGWANSPAVAIPERTRVYMMQDTVMAVPAIPLARDEKSYYGCCEMCNAKMATEPMRYTLLRVPVAEAVVDKAAAVLLRTNT